MPFFTPTAESSCDERRGGDADEPHAAVRGGRRKAHRIEHGAPADRDDIGVTVDAMELDRRVDRADGPGLVLDRLAAGHHERRSRQLERVRVRGAIALEVGGHRRVRLGDPGVDHHEQARPAVARHRVAQRAVPRVEQPAREAHRVAERDRHLLVDVRQLPGRESARSARRRRRRRRASPSRVKRRAPRRGSTAMRSRAGSNKRPITVPSLGARPRAQPPPATSSSDPSLPSPLHRASPERNSPHGGFPRCRTNHSTNSYARPAHNVQRMARPALVTGTSETRSRRAKRGQILQSSTTTKTLHGPPTAGAILVPSLPASGSTAWIS